MVGKKLLEKVAEMKEQFEEEKNLVR